MQQLKVGDTACFVEGDYIIFQDGRATAIRSVSLVVTERFADLPPETRLCFDLKNNSAIGLTKPISVGIDEGEGYLYRVHIPNRVEYHDRLGFEAYRRLFEAAPKMLALLKDYRSAACPQHDQLDEETRALIAQIESSSK